MRNVATGAFISFALATALAPPSHAEDFGTLPKSLDAPAPAPRPQFDRPDFRDLLHDVAPIGKADAAESAQPPPPADGDAKPAAPAPTRNAAAPEPTSKPAPPRSRPLERGIAVWYQHSGKTANGERFDPNGLTAAHRNLPFGARIRVVYDRTGKGVTVRVNDRISQKAMHRKDRLAIELSRRSAQAIGLAGAGTVSIYKVD